LCYFEARFEHLYQTFGDLNPCLKGGGGSIHRRTLGGYLDRLAELNSLLQSVDCLAAYKAP
jgi:hypothetical protein